MVSVAINAPAGPVEVCLFGNVTLMIFNKTAFPLYAYNVSVVLNVTSVMFNGTLPVCNISKTADGKEDKVKSTYDYVGALEYILVTVMVYSLMGIVSMLLTRIAKRANRAKRRKERMHENVARYIKCVDNLRKLGEIERRRIEVIKVRSALMEYQRSRSDDSQVSSDADDQPSSDMSRSLMSSSSKTDDISVAMPVTKQQFRTTKNYTSRENTRDTVADDVKTSKVPVSKQLGRHSRTCTAVLHVINEDSENEEQCFISGDK